MWSSRTNGLARLATAIALIALAASWPSAAQDSLDPRIDQATQDRIHELAAYSAPTTDDAERQLRYLGIGSNPLPLSWEQFPAVRKVEYAYLSAWSSDGNGGKYFLMDLGSLLGRKFSSLSDCVECQSPKPYEFRPAPIRPRATLSAWERRAIFELASYCETGPFGDTASVLQKHFGLSTNEAYDVLATADSLPHAFESAYLKARKDKAKLRSLAEEVSKKYTSAGTLMALFENDEGTDNKKPPKGNGASGSAGSPQNPKAPNSGGGGNFGWQEPTARQKTPSVKEDRKALYEKFIREKYPGRPFKNGLDAQRAEQGFGGIIFRATLQNRLGTTPVSATYSSSTQTLTIHLSDKTQVNFVTPFDQLIGALRVSGGTYPAEWSDALGGAFGILGLENGKDCQTATEHGPQACFKVVLHPGLTNLPIAREAIASDAFRYFNHVMPTQTEQRALDKVRTWANWDCFFRIADTEMAATRRGEELVVSRSDAPSTIPVSMLELSVLKMFAICGGKPNDTAAEATYRLMPGLYAAHPPLARLDGFARTLAVMRWLAQFKALPKVSEIAVPTNPTPKSVAIIKTFDSEGKVVTKLIPVY